MLDEKLKKLEDLVKLIETKTNNVSKADLEILRQEIEEYYRYDDGTVFTKKMYVDFKMWKSFEHEYSIDKIGIIKLRDILGTPKDFKEKYNIK